MERKPTTYSGKLVELDADFYVFLWSKIYLQLALRTVRKRKMLKQLHPIRVVRNDS
jgi:hypothetical protein